MMFLGILASIAAVALLCWLLFTLAVYALPAIAGATAGLWTYQSGAGLVGGILTGLAAAALTLGAGQFLLAVVRPLWLSGLIVLAFVAPAAMAGYHALHSILKHAVPSEGWQTALSLIGAVAIGITAFTRISAMALPGQSVRDMAGT